MHTYEDLSHIEHSLSGGGKIIIVDTGAIMDAEAQAMISARFSRWNGSTVELIKSMFNRDVGKFMRDNYQAGYGHKSIAELGEAVIFVENVSMLCAKAVQDFPLYRGQESSTRYIDFSKQVFLNPYGSTHAELLLEDLREFYLHGLDVLPAHLSTQYPRADDENEGDYSKAIKARAFDIMRSFLPAGASTNVAWVGDLRHVNDHLTLLRHHPLDEVREVGLEVELALAKKFPNSFEPEKRYAATEEYLEAMGRLYTYLEDPTVTEFKLTQVDIDFDLIETFLPALTRRPAKTELPWAIRECGTLKFEYPLDFGSYRDLQRQRAVVIPMPLLTPDLGFEPWYFDQMPHELAAEARVFVEAYLARIEAVLNVAHNPDLKFLRQYYLPMGMQVPIRMLGDLRALVYLIELRSTRFVHPTLVHRTRQKGEKVLEVLGEDVQLHMDPEPGRFDVRRGQHDFVKKV
jgi:thymidylate synthase ThyX